jgi:hypothetical protein
MKKRNSPGGDLGAAGEIAGGIKQDIDLISNYEGDSIEFYRAMQKRAINYVREIRHHFGDQLFPEGAHAPTTPAEMGEREWEALVRRAYIQIDLMSKAMELHGLAVDGLARSCETGSDEEGSSKTAN